MLWTLLLFAGIACSNPSGDERSPEKTNDRQSPKESPDITVQVDGMQQGPTYLVGIFTDQQYRVDSTGMSADGIARFKRDEPYLSGMLFVLLPDQSFIQILLDADQTFRLETKKGDLVNSMKVEGSLDNELLYKNLRFENDFQKRLNPVNEQLKNLKEGDFGYVQAKEQQDQLVAERKAHLEGIFREHPNSFFTSFKQAGQNPELKDVRKENGTLDTARQIRIYRQDFWDNVDLSDERLLYTPVISNKLKKYITELTPQHQDSIIRSADQLMAKVMDEPEYYKYFANWIALQYEPGKTVLMDGEAVYVHMIKKYITHEKAFWADSFQVIGLQGRAREMEASLIGRKGPDVIAKNPQGIEKSIYDLETPYVIVFMYNPDCEHCQEEAPKLVNWYRRSKDKGVSIYAIAIDTDDANWKKFITGTGMQDMVNVFDPTNKAIYRKYYVDNTPELYVLNPDRIIIGKNLKVDQIDGILERDKSRR